MRKFSKQKSALILFFLFVLVRVNSQDINFTLFNYNPLFINPANTGNFNGNWRLAGNYRNQWAATSTPFQTASLSFDTKFILFKQKMGAGLFFVNDESGASGLNFNKIFASIGYKKEINKNYLNFGIQMGYVFGSINDWGAWDNLTGSFTAPSGELDLGDKISYPDVNLGICWEKNIGIFEPEAGASFFHINSPKVSFLKNTYKEELKYNIHFKSKVKFNDKIFLLPSVLFMDKNKSSLTIIGTNLGYNFIGNQTRVKQIFVGIYLRNGLLNKVDSYSALIGTSVGNIDLAFSYDINISSFSQSAGNMGAFELSIIYRSISTLLNTYSIPCERY